jgi:Dolichyl-phosphate-mannose-protein mannosyltransferase
VKRDAGGVSVATREGGVFDRTVAGSVTGSELMVLAVVAAIGLGLRVHDIGYNLDGDEIFSVRLASQPFGQVVSASLLDKTHPPLHNFVLYLWMQAFGASEAAARSLSVCFAVGFLLAAHALFRRLLAPWLALALVTILAVSPFFVYYGQQARPYSLIALLATANMLAFLRVIEQPCRRRVSVWAASCVLLGLAQYVGVLIVLCELAVGLMGLPAARRALLGASAVAGVAILAWPVVAMGPSLLNADDPLTGIDWMAPPTPRTFMSFYVSIFGGVPGVLPRALMVVPLAVLALVYVRGALKHRVLPLAHVFLLLASAGVPVLVFLLSYAGPKALFAPRQLIGSAVAFVALIGLCLARLPRRAAAAYALVLVAWSAAALPEGFPRGNKPPWRAVAADISGRHDDTAVVAAQEAWVASPLNYYQVTPPARLWSDLGVLERADRLLFVCRPALSLGDTSRCSDIETEPLRSRCTVLSTWVWGYAGNSRLNLYRCANDGAISRHELP